VFDEFDPELLDEVTTPMRVYDLGESLFGGRQNALQSNEGHVLHQKRPHFLRPPSHVLTLESVYGGTDLGFEFASGLHCVPQSCRLESS